MDRLILFPDTVTIENDSLIIGSCDLKILAENLTNHFTYLDVKEGDLVTVPVGGAYKLSISGITMAVAALPPSGCIVERCRLSGGESRQITFSGEATCLSNRLRRGKIRL